MKIEEDIAGKGVEEVLWGSYYKLKEVGRTEDVKEVLKMIKREQNGDPVTTTSSAEALALLLNCR